MRKVISRRTFLHGSGVAIMLPALECMLPKRALAAATPPPLRFISIFFANGAVQNGNAGTAGNQWECVGTGTNYTLSAAMQPLAPHKADIIPIHGLSNISLDYAASVFKDPAHDHQYGPLAFLSGQPGRLTNYNLAMPGSSIDQMMGATTGMQLPVYYLGAQPAADGEGLIGRSHISWGSQTQLLPRIDTTRNAFAKLFGTNPNLGKLDMRKSILDNVLIDANSMRAKLGPTDRSRLDEYLSSVREMERRINAEVALTCAVPNPSLYSENDAQAGALLEMRATNMLDLIVLALKCDISRVITFQLDNEENNSILRNHGNIIRPTDPGHHNDSHYKTDLGTKPANHLLFNQWQTGKLAYLLQALKTNLESDGSPILDHSMILYGTSLGDSDAHAHDNVCTILAGKANGLLNPGRVMRYNDVPRENLLLTLVKKWGIDVNKVGLSTGSISDI